MSWQPRASLTVIRERARVYRQIRAFFNTRGFLEVDTPLLMPTTSTEVNIASIEVTHGLRPLYLQTSPEYAMKRLLAAGCGSIFQICHAFRQGESGRLHNIEFSLLEWYRVGYDYHRLMQEIELLITTLSLHRCSFSYVSYRQLFARSMQLDIDRVSVGELRRRCADAVPGADCVELDRDQCLDLLLAAVIAPSMQDYLFVYDYPLSQAALARANPNDSSVAERFELFHNGIELANGFSELTDAVQQRARFEKDIQARRERGLPELDIDERLLGALESGIEDCAGVALGLDRLLMVLLGLDSIEEALTFRD
ncbi:MAG: EF-P lysine aminoacylase EpmA [Gammaproteobacteria bacterium]|nr:EF-P lysine aminoacylase EpmA [Gammaproteobacteria bacterium]MDH3535266.1 EF-P lysine aminoacylase EpmA [Gammaproteobacteria bacterium]